jgi:hypothetical protein
MPAPGELAGQGGESTPQANLERRVFPLEVGE